MRKEIWFFHRLGLIEIVAAIIVIAGVGTFSGIWVTTEARYVYAHPADNIPNTLLVMALFLLFNGLLIGLCCAVAIYSLKLAYIALAATYRISRSLLAQPVRLVSFVAAVGSALVDKSRSIRRRLSR